MAANDKLQFEASAYLQTLIGRELIRTQEAAVVELVKNSYDSGAKTVIIRISVATEKRPPSIEIIDDGSGMDLQRLRKIFMVAGYSERPDEVGNERVPTGEKGIGRFASDRLGSHLLVETKTEGQVDGIVVDINWKAFENRKKKFNEISVPYYRRPIDMGKEQSGTRLTIMGLRETWERGNIETLRTVLSQLLNPYDAPEEFTITLDVPGSEKLSGPIETSQIAGANYDLRFHLNADGVLERKLRINTEKPVTHKETPPNAKLLAGLSGRLFYFLKRPPKQSVNGRPPGVFIYRDGFRVEPFGTREADWLGIAAHRAKRAGHAHVVPTRLFGFLNISRTKHAKLQDTTSREALIDNDQARALVHLLRTKIIDFLEDQIREAVAAPRWAENRAKAERRLQEVRYEALNVMSSGVAHELRQPLQVIRIDAGNIEARLRKLGITDPIIQASQESIDKSIERISQRIQLISELTGKKLDTNERFNLSPVIQEECSFLQERMNEQNITLSVLLPKSQIGVVSEGLVRMIVKNMVENAINALAKTEDSRKRSITVSLTGGRGQHEISVKDNGPGIPTETAKKLFSEFATHTTGGMGVGLYICQMLLKSHRGLISFTTDQSTGTTFTALFVDQEVTPAAPNTGS
ncbi:MAG TPA: sensor histidine kinase [Bryobacteraceae bacterium]